MVKDDYVRARVTKILKAKFTDKLGADGITEADFLTCCVLNYLGIETVPDELLELLNQIKNKKGSDIE